MLFKPLTFDLILNLFFYCCGCARYWGRQQVARVSNIQTLCLFVHWINAAKDAYRSVPLLHPIGVHESHSQYTRDRYLQVEKHEQLYLSQCGWGMSVFRSGSEFI